MFRSVRPAILVFSFVSVSLTQVSVQPDVDTQVAGAEFSANLSVRTCLAQGLEACMAQGCSMALCGAINRLGTTCKAYKCTLNCKARAGFHQECPDYADPRKRQKCLEQWQKCQSKCGW